jgi:hypothetical protein
MTESDWLGSADPRPMLDFLFLRKGATDRQLRLFAVACCRRVWRLLADERSRRAVEAAERFADGALSAKALRAAASAAQAAIDSVQDERRGGMRKAGSVYRNAAVMTADAAWRTAEQWRFTSARVALIAQRSTAFTRSALARTLREQAALLRDVLGDPFRPVALKPAWRTPDVRALARAAYEERALPAGTLERPRLAVLADALEEAGCSDKEVLGHLRGPGPHVRGCWALDAILAKG